VSPAITTSLGIRRFIELWHKVTVLPLRLGRGTFIWLWCLSLAPDRLLHLLLTVFRLFHLLLAKSELPCLLLLLMTRVHLDVGGIEALTCNICFFVNWVCSPSMNCIFPALIKLAILTKNVIV